MAVRGLSYTWTLFFASVVAASSGCQRGQLDGPRSEDPPPSDGGITPPADSGGAADSGETDARGQPGEIPEDWACNVFTNEGCEPGESCVMHQPWGANNPPFEPVCSGGTMHTQGPAEACRSDFTSPDSARLDTCQPASWCIGGTAEAPACLKICHVDDGLNCDGLFSDPQGNPIGGLCLGSIGGILPNDTPIRFCHHPRVCDPLCQDCTNASSVCIPQTDAAGHSGSLCVPLQRTEASAGVAGDVCSAFNGCQPGFVCVEDTCRAICALDPDAHEDATGCPFLRCTHASLTPGSQCREYAPTLTGGGYGLCD